MGRASLTFFLALILAFVYQNCSLNGGYSALKGTAAFGAGGGNGDGYTGIIFFAHIDNANKCGASNIRSLIQLQMNRAMLIKKDCIDITPLDITADIEWIDEALNLIYQNQIYQREQPSPTPTPSQTQQQPSPQMATFSCQSPQPTFWSGLAVCDVASGVGTRDAVEKQTTLKCVETNKGKRFVCGQNYSLTMSGQRYLSLSPVIIDPQPPYTAVVSDYTTTPQEMADYLSWAKMSYGSMICGLVNDLDTGVLYLNCQQNPNAPVTGN